MINEKDYVGVFCRECRVPVEINSKKPSHYKCPQCHQEYSSGDVAKLIDPQAEMDIQKLQKIVGAYPKMNPKEKTEFRKTLSLEGALTPEETEFCQEVFAK